MFLYEPSYRSPLVAIKARIEQSGFSGERIFEVKLANGKPYRGLAPHQFCWDSRNNQIQEFDEEDNIEGLVAARVIDVIDHDQLIVEIPNGEVIAVDKQDVTKRPTSITPIESKAHVSI